MRIGIFVLLGVIPLLLGIVSAEQYVQVDYSGEIAESIPFYEPDIGMTFLLVDITIANRGYDEISTSAICFDIIANGAKYDYMYGGSRFSLEELDLPRLEDVDLLDGGQRSGYLVFQIPEGFEDWKLTYDDYNSIKDRDVRYNKIE